MLTVEKLIEELKKYPQNMKVAINCDMSEDQSIARHVTKHNIDNAPYAKEDNIWFLHDDKIQKNEKVLYIH